MSGSVDDVFKFKMASSIADHGMRTITGNSSRRAKTQFTYAVFCIFLFFVYLFTNPDPETLGQLTPFLMPFLLFGGSIGTLLFYRTLLDSDIRGHCYIEKAAEEGSKLEHANISQGFFNAVKKTRSLKNLKLENLLYIGLMTFIAGLFAISTVRRAGWFAIVGVVICFVGLGVITSVVLLRDLQRMGNK